MTLIEVLLIIGLLLLVINILISLLKKSNFNTEDLKSELNTANNSISRIDPLIRAEFSINRDELQKNSKEARQELSNSLKDFSEQLTKTITDLANNQKGQFETFSNLLQTLTRNNEEKFEKLIKSNEEKANLLVQSYSENSKALNELLTNTSKDNRTELAMALKSFENNFTNNVKDFNELQRQKFNDLAIKQDHVKNETETKLEKIRETVETKLKSLQDDNGKKLAEMRNTVDEKQSEFKSQFTQLSNESKEAVTTSLKNNEDKTNLLVQSFSEKSIALNELLTNTSKDNRTELTKALKSFEDNFTKNVKDFNELQRQKFGDLAVKQDQIKSDTEAKLEKIRETVETKLKSLQDDNAKKLEEMRNTVDEKLQTTLEKRFNDSFTVISERLELVHKGLGEMQTLATSVGDIKKVMTNVKSRGIMGEYQLANILEDLLTNEQYEKNVKTKMGSGSIVEFAIKLPNNNNIEKTLWLPIDSKFPKEDYEALVEAYDDGDPIKLETLRKSFKAAIIKNAKDIKEKYIDPPNTTEYGIMFLPFESLYAEVLRTPGLFELLQKDFKITITGPTTLSALLNSLQMGFRTLAIEKRSSEVWDILSVVKTEFGKFGIVLEKTKLKLQQATSTIEQAGVRSRAIERQLKKVQELPTSEAQKLIEAEINEGTTDLEDNFQNVLFNENDED